MRRFAFERTVKILNKGLRAPSATLVGPGIGVAFMSASDGLLLPSAASVAPGPFETLVSQGCSDLVVADLGARTLVTTPDFVRLLEPGQPWAEAPNMSEGLPSGRGAAFLFARDPVVLEVERGVRQSRRDNSERDTAMSPTGWWLACRPRLDSCVR